jgi:hypothetical protein
MDKYLEIFVGLHALRQVVSEALIGELASKDDPAGAMLTIMRQVDEILARTGVAALPKFEARHAEAARQSLELELAIIESSALRIKGGHACH